MKALRWIVLGIAAVAVASCGGDGDAGGCAPVCRCVAAAGGDQSACNQVCRDVVAAGGGQTECRDLLSQFGFPMCDTLCNNF